MSGHLIRSAVLFLLLTTACSGRATPTPTLTPAPTQAATSVPTPLPASSGEQPAAVATVEEAAAINSYRLRVQTQSESPRGTDVVEIAGAYVKAPRAEEVTVTIRQGDRADVLAMIQVDGAGYVRVGETWLPNPDHKFDLGELTLITAADSAALVGQMERVGPVAVNDRPALHYRGGKEIIPVVGTPGDTLDVSRLETAQIEVWVDTAFQVVSRFVLTGSNSGADGQPLEFSVTFDYFDFNADIVVVAPAAAASTPAPTEEFVPRNELGVLLGFDLLFPTGSTVEVAGTALYIVVGPYTLDEAANVIERNLPANGYTQISKAGPIEGQIVYLFQLGQKVVTISLADVGDGTTRFRFAAGP